MYSGGKALCGKGKTHVLGSLATELVAGALARDDGDEAVAAEKGGVLVAVAAGLDLGVLAAGGVNLTCGGSGLSMLHCRACGGAVWVRTLGVGRGGGSDEGRDGEDGEGGELHLDRFGWLGVVGGLSRLFDGMDKRMCCLMMRENVLVWGMGRGYLYTLEG